MKNQEKRQKSSLQLLQAMKKAILMSSYPQNSVKINNF